MLCGFATYASPILPAIDADRKRLDIRGCYNRLWNHGPQRRVQAACLHVLLGLFDGHTFGQISRFVDVAAACHGDVVGDQLQGDAGDDRLEKLLDVRDFDNVVGK